MKIQINAKIYKDPALFVLLKAMCIVIICIHNVLIFQGYYLKCAFIVLFIYFRVISSGSLIRLSTKTLTFSNYNYFVHLSYEITVRLKKVDGILNLI